jgi:hypothetical protein
MGSQGSVPRAGWLLTSFAGVEGEARRRGRDDGGGNPLFRVKKEAGAAVFAILGFPEDKGQTGVTRPRPLIGSA